MHDSRVVPRTRAGRVSARWARIAQAAPRGWPLARPAAYGHFNVPDHRFWRVDLFAFVTQDFSVVIRSAKRPTVHAAGDAYRVSRRCGAAHEGSLLLWVLILALWTDGCGPLSSRQLSRSPLSPRVIGRYGLGQYRLSFVSSLDHMSNPFLRHIPVPLPDGNDLNPLLQDPAMADLPSTPMLYMGYVGFSVAFRVRHRRAAVRAASIVNWVRWSRPVDQHPPGPS